jgi:hypothetical protein
MSGEKGMCLLTFTHGGTGWSAKRTAGKFAE